MGDFGTYETVGGRPALRFDRRLAHPVGAVWRALTDSPELAGWFPQTVAFEALSAGAGVVFTFPGDAGPSDTGRVVDVHPPHLLAFTWFGEILTFELEPSDAAGTLLRFTQLLGDPQTAARTLAGWHVCLHRLADHLGGGPATAPGPDATDEWRTLYDAYVARGVPHGAPVPSR